MNKEALHLILEKVQRTAWAAFLLFLPVTSFPYFPPAIGGVALVRPLSVYPLIILIIIATLPSLINRPIPRTLLPLLLFVLIALASSLLSLLRGIEPVFGVAANARVFRGVFTLIVGCAIYLTVALLPKNIEDLRFSLRWIYAGGSLALFWGTLQIGYIVYFGLDWFYIMENAQKFISIRPLNFDRIPGMTYEPHWFADQIIVLLLPWILASVLTGYTVFRWRKGWLTIEWLLLGWSILVLPFTYSRAGLINLIALVFLSVMLLRPLHQHSARLGDKKTKLHHPFIRRSIEVFLTVIVVALPIFLIGTKNLFFARLWEYWTYPETSIAGYLKYLGFDARLTYNQAAYNTYKAFPILGVGLGNYAFYFEEMLPYRPIAEVPEALIVITPEMGRTRLITPKNYYLRLMAETGIVGTVTFLSFVIANLGGALYLWLSKDKESKYWGTASLCGIIAFTLSAFTFDSFVIPNMWVVFGMITAATRVLSNLPCPKPYSEYACNPHPIHNS